MTDRTQDILAKLSGASALFAFLLIAMGIGAPLMPTDTPLGPVMRIFDSLAPWFIGLGLVFAVVTMGLRARWIGGLLCVLALGGMGVLWVQHRAISLPVVPDQGADLRVIFLNVLRENAAFSHRILDAALEQNPDVLIFAEAEALYPALPKMRQEFEFVSPCALYACELLFAIRRKPTRFWRLNLNLVWDRRYAVSQFETETGKSVSVVANHLLKPWLSGVSEAELERLKAQYDWLSGPVVVLGDFNMAPWSAPMHDLLRFTGYKALRTPVATWPVKAGRFGVPIDHVLVHNGARVVSAQPFGASLGSNHRGLMVDIALP